MPETFWYIHIEQQRSEGAIKFNWRRNHLFDMAAAFVLYEMCVEQPEATVRSVATKPTTKWSVQIRLLCRRNLTVPSFQETIAIDDG